MARLDIVAFSALKTFDPPVSALHGLFVEGVARHGKFLDIAVDDLHLVVHLARGGWIRWKDELPSMPARPGKGPLAARLVLDDGSPVSTSPRQAPRRAWRCTSSATRSDVPGIARLGPDPLDRDLHRRDAGRDPARGGALADQGRAARPVDHRRHRQRLLRRDPARGEDVAVQAGRHDRRRDRSACTRRSARTLRDAIARSDGLAASELKKEKKSGLRVHGRTGEPCPVCGDTVREVSFADSSLQYCPTCQTGGKPLADRRLSRLLK